MSAAMFGLLTIVFALAGVNLSTAKSVVSSFNALTIIEAEDYSFSNYSIPCLDCSTLNPQIVLCLSNPQSTVGYYNVDFGTGAVKVNFNVDTLINANQSAIINAHLDDPQSPPFATIDLMNTNSPCNFITQSTLVTIIPFGFHDVYLTFKEVNFNISSYYLNWFSFEATSGNETLFNAFDTIQAESCSAVQGTTRKYCPLSGITYMGDLKYSSVLAFFGVNFGSGFQVVQLRVAAWNKGTVYLHLDSPQSQPFTTIAIQPVGSGVDYCNFFVIQEFVTDVPTGVHDLYFTVDTPIGIEDFVNIDWFSFKSTTA